MAEKCIVCKKEVIWEEVVDQFEYIFDEVDSRGEIALTYNQQMVYNGRICSEKCYRYL